MNTSVVLGWALVLLPACQALTATISTFDAGLSPTKLEDIPAYMRGFVEKGEIAGAVTLVARNGAVGSLAAVGMADLAARRPMRADSLFWIASMTKPITATAVMMLQDEGKLNIDDPVEKYLPEFKDQWMVTEKTAGGLTLARPPRPITLRNLLTHTSGLGDVPPPRPDCSLAELVMAYARQPLNFAPGSQWAYSNSGINTLGRIVEVISGQKFENFLQTRLFTPLRMRDTTFWPQGAQLKRLAKAYQPAKDGKGLEETDIWFFKGAIEDRRRTPFPAGGLFSTAEDLYKFYQMILDGGEANGRRYLSREAVAQMTRTQTGTLKTGFVEGMSFGLGWAVVRQPIGVTAVLSPGSFGHGGAYGTQGWIDPEKKMIFVLMIQRAKLPNADASDIRRVFQETAVKAIVR